MKTTFRWRGCRQSIMLYHVQGIEGCARDGKQFFKQSMAVLLTLRAECSLVT
jgi:hypothetical protein